VVVCDSFHLCGLTFEVTCTRQRAALARQGIMSIARHAGQVWTAVARQVHRRVRQPCEVNKCGDHVLDAATAGSARVRGEPRGILLSSSRPLRACFLETPSYLRRLDQQAELLRAWHLRCSSARSAQCPPDTLLRSVPSSDFMRFEVENSGFIQRGSFFNSTPLPARTN
jgi:hypothetical protein